MGRRYYCDYCDRSFIDDPEARKKHLSSLQHAKNRMHHYSLFKDAEDILKEESSKKPCTRYMTAGDCAFGVSCRYSHYTPPMIWELQRQITMKKEAASRVTPKDGWPNSDEIIREFLEDDINADKMDEISVPQWHVPIELHNYPNLPPSLWPITPASLMDSNFSKWS